MPISKLASYLLLLAGAIIVDVVLYRWRLQTWRATQTGKPQEGLILRVDGLYGRSRDWMRRTIAGWANSLKDRTSQAADVSRDEAAAGVVRPAPMAAADSTPPAKALGEPAPAETERPVRAAPDGAEPVLGPQIEQRLSTTITSVSGVVSPQAANTTSGMPVDGLARVNVSVEMPVGATIRLTIETSAGVEPRVILEPVSDHRTLIGRPSKSSRTALLNGTDWWRPPHLARTSRSPRSSSLSPQTPQPGTSPAPRPRR